jgi:hypothetical protein
VSIDLLLILCNTTGHHTPRSYIRPKWRTSASGKVRLTVKIMARIMMAWVALLDC